MDHKTWGAEMMRSLLCALMVGTGILYLATSHSHVVLGEECATRLTLPEGPLSNFVIGAVAERTESQERTEKIWGIKIDLRGDGSHQYLVATTGGSGGTNYLLIAESPPRIVGELFAYVL